METGIDKDTFKQIFRDHWNAFTAKNPLHYATGYHDEVVQKMLGCGDPEKMGFAQYRCTSCGETHRVAFSCKSSFCLSCAKVYSDQWVDFIGRRMFTGVVYRHIVLTVPDSLRLWFYRNPDILLSPFMRAGHACLLDVLETCAKVGLDIGSIIVLQTAGRPGIYNPHLHILLTEGKIEETAFTNWQAGLRQQLEYLQKVPEFMCSMGMINLLSNDDTRLGPPTLEAVERQNLAAGQAWLERLNRGYGVELGEAWHTDRLIYTAIPKSFFVDMRSRLRALGEDTSDLDRFDVAGNVWPDDQVDVEVDVSDVVDRKWSALQCHQTQFGPDNLFRRLPDEDAKALMSREYFAIAWPEISREEPGSDLFA